MRLIEINRTCDDNLYRIVPVHRSNEATKTSRHGSVLLFSLSPVHYRLVVVDSFMAKRMWPPSDCDSALIISCRRSINGLLFTSTAHRFHSQLLGPNIVVVRRRVHKNNRTIDSRSILFWYGLRFVMPNRHGRHRRDSIMLSSAVYIGFKVSRLTDFIHTASVRRVSFFL